MAVYDFESVEIEVELRVQDRYLQIHRLPNKTYANTRHRDGEEGPARTLGNYPTKAYAFEALLLQARSMFIDL